MIFTRNSNLILVPQSPNIIFRFSFCLPFHFRLPSSNMFSFSLPFQFHPNKLFLVVLNQNNKSHMLLDVPQMSLIIGCPSRATSTPRLFCYSTPCLFHSLSRPYLAFLFTFFFSFLFTFIKQ